jgi:hypothetical protein
MAPGVSGIERLLFGVDDAAEIDRWLAELVAAHLGAPLRDIIFRAGRIDAVYGARLSDGRRVVIKVHRPPANIAQLTTQSRLQGFLAAAGFPAARPISGPSYCSGHTVSVEELLGRGDRGDPHDPRVRRAMARGLVQLIDLLRGMTDRVDLAEPAAWTRYRAGRWLVSHDSMFDFAAPVPAGWEFVDDLTALAAGVLAQRDPESPVVIGRADWHGGNLRFGRDGRGIHLTAVFDMDLFIDTEPVVAGFAAANHLSGSGGGDTPTPGEVTGFLADYDAERPGPFTAAEQRHAAAAATLALTYNGRCGLSVMKTTAPEPQPPRWSPLTNLRLYRRQYLKIRW